MAHLPADTLRNRTFVGLLIAQFLAAFNDQAIHASAMFFAINQKVLTDAQAITLMPILFYAPWAVFVTLAGYFADRFSKRNSLVFWKLAEIAIMVLATFGFWLGDVHRTPSGPWLVLACVFLMGMHSAFFVPAKYGAMPEILQPQLLSRGNGILESLSFLAVILGTVCGGLLSGYFDDDRREYWIGAILLVLAVVGAMASLLIEKMPAANRHRPFPPYVYGPLVDSLRTLVRSRPLKLAMVGIAFFTFMVAFMRATVYMLGESQIPRWTEEKTSLIVGATSLGIGLGAPLAGLLSGRKIELGLVPLGALGMCVAAVLGGAFIDHLAALVTCIVAIGFFTGFYLVPLFSLQQHRAPKASKGDVIAANNFVNVIGATLASVVFFLVVFTFKQLGAATPITPNDGVARGALVQREARHGQTTALTVEGEKPLTLPAGEKKRTIEITSGIPALIDPDAPPAVVVSAYDLRGVRHYKVRMADEALETVYDTAHLPRYLFFGAGLMAVGALGLLRRELPDLFDRMEWAIRSVRHIVRQNRLHVVGTARVPADGPVVLVTNCRSAAEWRTVISATDRAVVPTKLSDDALAAKANAAADGSTVLLLAAEAVDLLPPLQARLTATYLPVYYGPAAEVQHLRVAFGGPLPQGVAPAEAVAQIQAAAALPDDEH